MARKHYTPEQIIKKHLSRSSRNYAKPKYCKVKEQQ
jgi:hypothetical protein